MVTEAFFAIAAETGDTLELVYKKIYEDKSFNLVFWAHGETVLVIAFDPTGCAMGANELSLSEFRDATGIVLAVT